MSRSIDLTGQRFGRLVALKQAGKNKQQNALWLCLCDCGKTVIVSQNNLRKGGTKSCGCFKADCGRNQFMTHGLSKDENGKQTRLYGIWAGIKKRCLNPRNQAYKDYGGRGILIVEAWLLFENFYAWAMSHGYRDDLTIERKDVNGNYCPENCIWIPLKNQARNTRGNHIITYDGKTMLLTDWTKTTGIDRSTLALRLKKGWTEERALTETVQKRLLTFQGETKTATQWAKDLNINAVTVFARLLKGWPIEKVLAVTKFKPGRRNP